MSLFLMEGHVYHSRTEKAKNSFKYPIFNIFFNVDNEASLKLTFKKVFFKFLNINAADYLAYDTSLAGEKFLAGKIRKFLSKNFAYQAETVCLQTIPQMLGYAFNPVNFWYCFNKGTLDGVLCEVHNTFGETHCYWLYQQGESLHDKWLRADKNFHVSPFFKIEGEYRFRFCQSLDSLHVDLQFLNADGTLKLNTWVQGSLKPLAQSSLWSVLWRYGWITPLVFLRIHYQAVKLFFKKAQFYKKPNPPSKEITRGTAIIRR